MSTHLAVRIDPALRARIGAVMAQYNEHATLSDWVTAWLEQMVSEIEKHGADHRTLLPLSPTVRALRRS